MRVFCSLRFSIGAFGRFGLRGVGLGRFGGLGGFGFRFVVLLCCIVTRVISSYFISAPDTPSPSSPSTSPSQPPTA